MKMKAGVFGCLDGPGLLVGAVLIASLFEFAGTGSGAEGATPAGQVAAPATEGDVCRAPAMTGERGDQVAAAFEQLPLYFIENTGQIDDEVAYYLIGADKTLYFTSDGVTMRLRGPHRRWTVKLDFVKARSGAVPQGKERQKAVFSYFTGTPEEWHTGCPTYTKIVYPDLWPGIDLVLRGLAGQLKYEFIVRPGADPARIRLAYRGVDEVRVNEAGALEIATAVASFDDAKPVAYQEVDSERAEVRVAYAVDEERGDEVSWTYGFAVGSYDRQLPLVLDPSLLLYCGYIGGAENESAFSVAVDSTGAAYVSGTTESDQATFPVKLGPDLTHNGFFDVFVAKVARGGEELEYCGYIGGANDDWGAGVAVDASGAAYVVGSTASAETDDFPVVVGPDLTYNGGEEDAFIAKVMPDGTGLVYCGYIGGALGDYGGGVAADATGAAYLAGWTESDENTFPKTVGPDLSFNGVQDAFVAKVEPTGQALVYCGYIGGTDEELGGGIALDDVGSAYVIGEGTSTESDGFPVLVGPDLTHNGENDVFVAKVLPSGSGLVYCGFVGGADDDYSCGIAVRDRAAYLRGNTYSSETTFPEIGGPGLTYSGNGDAFVAKVKSTGDALDYCGYLGGTGDDCGLFNIGGIAVDEAGAAYVTGTTASSESQNFPVLIGPDLTFNGSYDAFVAKIDPSGTGLAYCGYIGGIRADSGYDIDVDGSKAAYVAGSTNSAESDGFPVLVGPDLSYNQGYDAFVGEVPPLDLVPASWANYGSGWPGTNGVPCFTASANPVLCKSITLDICNSRGAPTPAFLLLGLNPANIPTPLGGTLLVLPGWIFPIPLGMNTNSLPGQIPCDATLAGLSVYLQVLEMDPGASHGFSFTEGLLLVLGYY